MLVFLNIKNHNNTAYEFFTKNGPLAILPSPSFKKKNQHLFILQKKNK